MASLQQAAVQKLFLPQCLGQQAVLVMRQKFDALICLGFVRSVGVLVGGRAFAQALMVLPLLTRLYTPEDFGVLAVYASILGIISVAACLRLETAVPLQLLLKVADIPTMVRYSIPLNQQPVMTSTA